LNLKEEDGAGKENTKELQLEDVPPVMLGPSFLYYSYKKQPLFQYMVMPRKIFLLRPQNVNEFAHPLQATQKPPHFPGKGT